MWNEAAPDDIDGLIDDPIRIHEVQQFIDQAIEQNKIYEVVFFALDAMKFNPEMETREAFIAGFNKAVD